MSEVDRDGNPIEEPQKEVEDENTEVPETEPESTTEVDDLIPPLPPEENFLDPKNLPKELLPAFKSMQASYTRRMQTIAKERKDLEIAKAAYSPHVEKSPEVPTPQSPQDTNVSVEQYVRNIVSEVLGKELKPVHQSQNEERANRTISYLDTNHSDWRLYDDVMAEMAVKHPTLTSDPSMLYQLAKSVALKNSPSQQKRLAVIVKPSVGGSVKTTPKRATTIDEAIAMTKKEHGLK